MNPRKQTAQEDLEQRLVGSRYYDRANEEALTVIGVSESMAFIQYDDGVAWDELVAPELVTETESEKLRVSVNGLDDERYKQLPDGPRLSEACDEEDHDWTPTPADLGWDDREIWASEINGKVASSTYNETATCRKCGLTAESVSNFLGHATPDVCTRCDSQVLPGESELVFSPTNDWAGAVLCGDCHDAVVSD